MQLWGQTEYYLVIAAFTMSTALFLGNLCALAAKKLYQTPTQIYAFKRSRDQRMDVTTTSKRFRTGYQIAESLWSGL